MKLAVSSLLAALVVSIVVVAFVVVDDDDGVHSKEERNSLAAANNRFLMRGGFFANQIMKNIVATSDESGITFSRTIVVAENIDFHLGIKGDYCTSHDEYGENDCHFGWGDSVDATLDLETSVDYDQGDEIHGNFKVDKYIPFKFTCKMCGEDCVLHIPVIDKDQSFPMPDCPIPAHSVSKVIEGVLPKSSPTKGVKTRISGTLSLINANGHTTEQVKISAEMK